jgi:hypothetical protein
VRLAVHGVIDLPSPPKIVCPKSPFLFEMDYLFQWHDFPLGLMCPMCFCVYGIKAKVVRASPTTVVKVPSKGN